MNLAVAFGQSSSNLAPPGDLCKTNLKKNVDMRKKFGPIRHQGQVGWCYALAGADILGHWLQKNGYTKDATKPEGMVSGTDLALQYLYSKHGENPRRSKVSAKWQDLPAHLAAFNEQLQKRVETETLLYGASLTDPEQDINNEAMRILGLSDSGIPAHAILSGVEGGVCFEKDLPSQTKASDYMQSAGETLQKSLNKFYMGSQGLIPRAMCAYDLAKVFPGIGYTTIEKALRNGHAVNPVLFLAEKSCRRRILDHGKPTVHNRKIRDITPGKSLLETVNEKLESGIPLVVYYGSAIFDYQGPKMKSEIANTQHASVIVGKRYDCKTKNWNYLIRNSWGPDSCLDSQKAFQEKNRSTAPYACDQGHYVVPSDLLKSATSAIDWLE
jgi:hypothetical protein